MVMMAGLAAITVMLTLRSDPAPTNQVAAVSPAAVDAAAPEALASAAPDSPPIDSVAPVEAAQAAPAEAPAADPVEGDPVEAEPVQEVAADAEADVTAEGASEGEPNGADAGDGASNDGASNDGAASDGASSDGAASDGSITEDFAADSGEWTVMTGTWAVTDGVMVQSNAEGFDYINQLGAEVPDEYEISVQMRGIDGTLGGGLIVGQLSPGTRKGAYVIDFTNGGAFLRWGRYEPDTGLYSYIGGLNVGASADDWHELRVEVRADTSLVYLDGAYLGDFEPVEAGTVGLMTSESAVEFDDLVIEALS